MNSIAWPKEFPRSKWCTVSHGDGMSFDVLSVAAAHLCVIEAPVGEVFEVVVQSTLAKNARVHPVRHPANVGDESIRLKITSPAKILVEPADQHVPALAIIVRPPSEKEASRFAPGHLYEAGVITLRDNETLHIPTGAIVRGRIRVEGDHVRISGGGILDLDHKTWNSPDGRALVADCVEDLRIDGLTIVNPPCWMVVLGGCKDVQMRDLVLLGKGYATDGIDVVGSSNVRASDGLIISGDNCIAVKSFKGYDGGAVRGSWARDVHYVTFEHFLLGNHLAGSAMEIGHELNVDFITDITFRDIEVAHVHDHAAAFSIHNADRAAVDRVIYERVTVNHCFDKLIDFRVVKSRWGTDDKRARPGRSCSTNFAWTARPSSIATIWNCSHATCGQWR
jgi:Glycosyl hydrolases family 28